MAAVTPAVRFIKGGRFLDINSGWYCLDDGFTPPTTQSQATYGSSTFGSDLMVNTPVNQDYACTIHITATSIAGQKAALNRLSQFVSQAGDKAEPLYFATRDHADYTSEPTIGEHDCYQRYEVVKAEVISGSSFYVRDTGVLPFVQVQMVLKPFKTIRPMRLATAKGAVFMDDVATVDGRSRGLQVAPALTNKVTNPMFGAGATTGWTASGVTAALTSKKEYIVFGRYAVRLAPVNADGTYTQSLNVGNTNTHALSFYVKRQDGGAVTSSVVNVRFKGASQTPDTIRTLENGWYRVTYSGAGQASSTTYGITVKAGYTVYVDGFQIVEQAETHRFWPLIYGDRLGCSWSGTEHQSTSSNTAGYARYPVEDYFTAGNMTIRFVWEFDSTQAQLTANQNYFTDNNGNLRVFYSDGSQAYAIGDGTGTTTGAVDTFTPGTRHVFHAVFDKANSEMRLYKNGSSIASASYTVPTLPSYFYIGSTGTPNTYAGGTCLGFAVYPFAMSATQISDDYTRITPLVTAGQRVDAVPFIWTKDGDDQVDEFNDSDEDNFCVVAEVPGDAEAETLLDIAYSGSSGQNTALWIMGWSWPRYLDPGGLYNDRGGTATSSSDSGGEVQTESITTSETTIGLGFGKEYLMMIDGKPLHGFMRAQDAGSDLQVRLQAKIDALTIDGEFQALTTAAARWLFKINPIPFYSKNFLVADDNDLTVAVNVILKRTTGTANLLIDLIMFAPNVTRVDTSSSGPRLVIKDRYAAVMSGTGTTYDDLTSVVGKPLTWTPNEYNVTVFIPQGKHEASWQNVSITLSPVYVYPKYRLL